MNPKEEVMIKFNPSFQRVLFKKIINYFGSSIKAGKYLEIPASSVRGYKNLYFKCVPDKLISKVVLLNIISYKEINKNKILVFSKKDSVNKILDKGREKRKNYFNDLKNNLPPVHNLIRKNELNFKKWFYFYKYLLESGFRKLTFKEQEDYLLINYSNFAKKEYKQFEVKIPQKFFLDKDFLYFFGLWCGDRAGGKRFGVCNKNKEILDFTEKKLKDYHQKIERILYIKKMEKEPTIFYDKKVIINKEGNGWVLSIHSSNGILSSFFNFLLSNIDEFLSLIKDKPIFFAGLFDAEGNVSLYNKSFRWACKNKELVGIYSKYLKEMNLYDNYDGGSLISYNLKVFYKRILPFLKHPIKINKTNFLVKGNPLPEEYLLILEYIKNNPNKTSKEIAKALKKNKLYSELRLLSNFNFLTNEGIPHKFKLNNKKVYKLLGD